MKVYNIIINKLLDKYEKKSVLNGRPSVTLKIKNIFPSYPDVNFELFSDIKSSIDKLAFEGFVTVHKEALGNLYEKITLNCDCVSTLYNKVNRIPIVNVVSEIYKTLASYKDKHIILDNYIVYLEQKISKDPSFLSSNFETIQNILKGMLGVLNNCDQLFYRQFSVKTFGDSKVFENRYIHQICSNIYKYGDFDFIDEGDTEALLEAFNILKNPAWIQMKGCAIIEVNGHTIDVSAFKDGVSFSSTDLVDAKVFLKTNEAYTVENLTTFNTFDSTNCFVLYLAGFHNSAKTRFLKSIYESNSHASYYHFGDIDAGGFYIYLNLCEKTNIPFIPYKMNIETLQTPNYVTKKLEKDDRKRLQILLKKDTIFNDVIRYMLKNNCKLEQEVVQESN